LPEDVFKRFIFAVGILNTENNTVSAFKKEKVALDTFISEMFACDTLRNETFALYALRSETFNLVFIAERVAHEIKVFVSFI
jgi:hypothetical protein